MKARQPIMISVMLIIISLAFVSPFISTASGPVVVQNNETDQNSTTAITSTFVNAVTKGDLLVYQIFQNQTNGGSHPITLFDNVSTPLTKVTSVNATFSTSWVYSAIYYGIANATKIRVELNSSASTGLGLYIWEVSGLSIIRTVNASIGSSGGCSCSLNTPITSPNGPAIAFGGVVLAPAHNGGTWTFTAGYVGTTATQQVSAAEYFGSGAAISSEFPISYTGTLGGTASALSGVIFYQGPSTTTSTTGVTYLTSTITKFVPPSPASLRFWWYPMIVLGTLGGLYLAVGLAMKVSQEDLIHMGLLGFVQAGWIAYAMQILPLGFQMAQVALYVAYLVLLGTQ